MNRSRIPALFAAFLCSAVSLSAQLSTITTFSPPDWKLMPPAGADAPDAVAGTADYYFAQSASAGLFWRRIGSDTAWHPDQFQFSSIQRRAIADAGNAVLAQEFTYDFQTYTYQLLRTEHGPDELDLVMSVTLTGSEGLETDRTGIFNVINDNLIYFSLERSSGLNYTYRNFISTDNGRSWTPVNHQLSLASVRRAGNLFVLRKPGNALQEVPDSLYWSTSPLFGTFNRTPAPPTKKGFRDMYWQQDTLFYFTTTDSMYYSASGGLFWTGRAMHTGAENIQEVLNIQGRFFLATNKGMFSAASPFDKWQPVYRYQDTYLPNVNRIYAPDNGIPWLSGAATGLLRPVDPEGSYWQGFEDGLPGYGAARFRALGDTLYANAGYTVKKSTDGIRWQPERHPVFQGVINLNCLQWLEHLGNVYAAGGKQDYYVQDRQFIRPAHSDWMVLDSSSTIAGEPAYLVSGGPVLYRYTAHNLQRSDDAGTTWKQITQLDMADAIYSAQAKGDSIFFFTTNPYNLWRSFDGGYTWTGKPLPVSSGYYGHLLLDGNRLVLGWDHLRCWESSDWGDHWVQTNLGLPNATFNVVYQPLGTLWVAHMSNSNFSLTFYQGVLISMDHGRHWLKINPPIYVYDGSSTVFGFERFGGYFYYSHPYIGNYRFSDGPVLQKLQQISPPVAVSDQPEPAVLKLAPNPATGETWLEWPAAAGGPLNWELTDMQGKMLRRGLTSGTRTRIDLGGLPAGPYALSLPGTNFRTLRFLVGR